MVIYVLYSEVLKLEWSWWYICKNVEVKFTIAPATTKLFNMSIQLSGKHWLEIIFSGTHPKERWSF